MVGKRSPVGEVLVSAVRGDHAAAVALAQGLDGSIAELPAAAAFHGVEAFVHQAIGSAPGLPSDVTGALRDDYYRVLLTRQQVLADLADIVRTLGGKGIEPLVLKGPALAELHYPDPTLRSYHDLDLLVRPAQLPLALDTLEAAGHRLLDANWDQLFANRAGEVHLMAPRGTVVDLHWQLFNDEELRSWVSVDVEDAIKRSRRTEINGCPVRVLDRVDNFVFVGVHACRSGGDRLIWLQDVALCARDAELDPAEAWRRVDEWRVRTAIELVVGRAEDSLGAIPAGLRPPPNVYARIDSLLTRMSPIQDTAGRRSAIRLLARAAGDRPSDSAWLFVRRAGRWAREGAPRGEPDTIDRDPDSPLSPLHPTGGAEDRERFLAAVAENRL
jgi:hypothetical protein